MMLAYAARTQIEEHAIAHAIDRLIHRYEGRFTPDEVRVTADTVLQRYADAHIHSFLPVFLERETRRNLDAHTS